MTERMIEKSGLLDCFGISSCAAIREVSLPYENEIYVSEDKNIFVLMTGDEKNKKSNLVCKSNQLDQHTDLLNIIYNRSNLYLCSNKIKLNQYLKCKKVDVGFFYQFQPQKLEYSVNEDITIAELTDSQEFIGDIQEVFIRQKKNPKLGDKKQWLMDDTVTLCAKSAGQLIGVLVATIYQNAGFLNLIYIREDYRNRNIGTALLQKISGLMYEKGYPHFYGMSPYNKKSFYQSLDIIDIEGWVLWEKQS
ncbi:MAG: GNAT family N-acetyltransferase [Clostridia bacterium]|nr:GNAT family N-acetyltransferase [Clostridia bacterium]